MFELLKISEYIYEGVVEPSYKQSNRADSTRDVQIRKNRGEAASSNN